VPSTAVAIARVKRVAESVEQLREDATRRPELLATWWGPNGFTNTFELFEFKRGGHWKYVMHGPNESHFANESVFLEVQAPSRIVIHHISKPRYVLTVTIAAHAPAKGTAITWTQVFEDAAVGARIRHIVEPANEQNLDRLEAALAGDLLQHAHLTGLQKDDTI
jgi:uncharacterized protein YndB with AHSA1/START domain